VRSFNDGESKIEQDSYCMWVSYLSFSYNGWWQHWGWKSRRGWERGNNL